MTISVACPDCGKVIKVPDNLAGRTVKSKGCGATMKVPATMPEVDPHSDMLEDD